MIIDKLHPILRRFRAPEPGDDGGGNDADRGDDFVPTEEDADADKDVKDAADKGDDKGADDKNADKGDDKGADDKNADKDTKAEKDEKGRKDSRIPFARHKEILEKEREAREEAERKLAQYQGGDRVAATNAEIKKAEDRILAIDKEYTKLLTDGEHEKAAEKRREMRALENEVIELKSDMKAAASSAQAVEKMRYDITVERLEAAYPTLNPEHEEHDADATQDVLDLASTYRTRRGMTPAQAIQKAAEKLLGVATKKQEVATTVVARVDKTEAEEAAEKEAKEAKEAQRKKDQVGKNLDANKRQPPDTTKRGTDSDKAGGGIGPKDVLKMSQDDFNKLDDQTLARLRGDVVA